MGWFHGDTMGYIDTHGGGLHTDGNMAREDGRLRQYLRGWAKNISGQYKKGKKEIVNTLDTLDKKAEHTPLQAVEINIKQCLNNRLAHLLRVEEIKWYQRAKTKDLLEGHPNTKYF
jgi:hypothetical protein